MGIKGGVPPDLRLLVRMEWFTNLYKPYYMFITIRHYLILGTHAHTFSHTQQDAPFLVLRIFLAHLLVFAWSLSSVSERASSKRAAQNDADNVVFNHMDLPWETLFSLLVFPRSDIDDTLQSILQLAILSWLSALFNIRILFLSQLMDATKVRR